MILKRLTRTEKSSKFCHIYRKFHDTEECRYNIKNSEKPNKSLKRKETERRGALSGFKNKKKIWAVIALDSLNESDSNDKEKSSKPSSSKRINSANLVKTAFIKEIEDNDEPSDPLPPSDKGKGKKKTFGVKDFLQSTM